MSRITLLAICTFMMGSTPCQLKEEDIVNHWWTCSACGHSNPAGTVRCEICGKHK